MNTVVRTGEIISPTPPLTYEPRLWQVRIFTPEDNRVGVPVMFKAPYGVYMNALQVLGRAMARGQITRITYGPIPRSKTRELDREDKGWRGRLERYEVAFERVGLQLGIDWGGVMGIYGKLTEHPEVPIEDPDHFTVQLKFHEFERQTERQFQSGRMRRVQSPFCAACGFNRITPVHPKES